MSTAEIINLAAIVVGPIFAVLISVWLSNRKQERDQKIIVLRMLLSTRHLPADPGFSVAINLIPVEFGDSKPVMAAYKDFIQAVQNPANSSPDLPALQSSATKTTKLIFEIARHLGFDIRETDIQHAGYAAAGWIERDNILLDSQRAMTRTANALWLQTRIMLGLELTDIEKQAVGLPPPTDETKN
ncbi:MAG TPA: DUF6680 family protein [Qipengyuania sp.]|nr:DUF6680 family protein [Qipengyuania sp.]